MDRASNGFNATRERLQQQLGSRAVDQAQTPLAADHADRYSESKRPWPSIEYQPRWLSTGHPPSPLSPGSAPEVRPAHYSVQVVESEKSVNIHIAPNHYSGESSAPATRSTSFTELSVDQLECFADFLDFADLLSLAQTSRANNEFVTITFPELTDLSQKQQLALKVRGLVCARSWSGAAFGLGGMIAVISYVTLQATGDDVLVAEGATAAILQVIGCIGCAITVPRLRRHQHATQEFDAALRAFESARESRRALAPTTGADHERINKTIATTQEAARRDSPSPDSSEEQPPTEAINTTPPSSP